MIAKIIAARSATDLRRMPDRMPIGMPRSQPDHGGTDREGPGDGDPPGQLLPHRDETVVRVVDVLVEPEPLVAPRGVTRQHEHRIARRPRDEPLEEPPVLDVERLVQTERPACVLDLLGCRGATDRPASRVAGRELHEDEEREERDDHDHEDHEEGSSGSGIGPCASSSLRRPAGASDGTVRGPLARPPRPSGSGAIRCCRARPASRTPPDQRTGRTSSCTMFSERMSTLLSNRYGTIGTTSSIRLLVELGPALEPFVTGLQRRALVLLVVDRRDFRHVVAPLGRAARTLRPGASSCSSSPTDPRR